MEFYRRFGFSDLHPFLLFIINESKLLENQIDEVFEVLESYILRRMLCYGQKAARDDVWINKFFKKIFTEESKKFELGELVKHLSESKYAKWPTDTEVEDSLGKVGAESKVARYILYRIECWQRENDRFTEKVTLPPDQFTLEHIMPQSWRDSWPLPIEDGDEKWFGDLYTAAYKKANRSTWNKHPQPSGLVNRAYKAAHDLAERRKNLIQSIGNLTIVSGDFNRDGLGNHPFDKKKNLLFQHSDLRLNKVIYRDYDNWDVDQICDRTTRLFKDFRRIWRSADRYVEKITGQAPEPKAKPDWISILESGDYQIVTCTKGLVNLSKVTVTSELDIMGSYEDGREDLLDRLDVIFAYPTTARDDLKGLIKNLEGQEHRPIMNENRQLRVWDTLLSSSQENKVHVTMKTCSMHELAGTIKKFDDEAIYMRISGCDVIVFRHSLLEFATDESYDGEVENWGALDYGFIKCSTNPHKAWQDIYVTTEFLGEGVTSLIPGQKVEFNVKMVLKNGRPRLEARNVALAETELHDGKVTRWLDGKGYGFIKSNDREEVIFVYIDNVVRAEGMTSLQQGQKVKFNIAQTVKGSEKQLQAYNVVLVEELYEGVVANFNSQKGYGLIEFNKDQNEEDQNEVFVHISDVQDNKQLKIGQRVKFSTEFSKKHSKSSRGRLEARNVTLVETQELPQGVVAWINHQGGFGRIRPNTHQSDHPEGIFVHVSHFPNRDINSLQLGQKVEFNIIKTEKGLQACNVALVETEGFDSSEIETEKFYYGTLENDWLPHYLYNFIRSDKYSGNVKVWPKDIHNVSSDHISSLRQGQQLQFNIDEVKREARNVVIVKDEE